MLGRLLRGYQGVNTPALALIKRYNYNRFAVETSVPFTGIGVGVGAVSYIVKDHGRGTTLSDHIMGGAFYATVGGVAGIVTSLAHPILFAGLVVGIPSYTVQKFRDSRQG